MGADSTPEGTIRFGFELQPASEADRVPRRLFGILEGWRAVLRDTGLVGRDPSRYEGLAFGNLSVRDPSSAARFFISASRCVAADALDHSQYPRIDRWDLHTFGVHATGTRAPSSETLTHAALYDADPVTHWVFHVHAPEIWQRAESLGLPATRRDTPYGSPELAAEVATLLGGSPLRPFVFVTPGHEDGVFACGADADTVGCALVSLLARSRAAALT